ncbi:MAG TPA: hypothetical protein VK850_08100, partial [Candidatus Binatia bacterium]|nr:hypothetical protein [Candidatus Binatia bacterium]
SATAHLYVLAPICLEPASDTNVFAGGQLVVTIRGCDTNRSLTFTLCDGPGRITPDGVFTWTPNCNQGSATHVIRVCVADSTYPTVTSSLAFAIAVPECIQAGLGNTVMLVGTTSSVPVRLLSTTTLTNMSFIVGYPTNRFDTNFTLAVNSPIVITQEWHLIQPGQILLSFMLPAANILYGPTNVGTLTFKAFPNQSSAFVPLLISNVTGLKTNGFQVANAFGTPGRVVLIGNQPLLEAWSHRTNDNIVPMLNTYGRPNATYGILYSNELNCSSSSLPTNCILDSTFWPLGWTVTLPSNLLHTAPLPPAVRTISPLYLRAREQ